jgi:hypothetical protein
MKFNPAKQSARVRESNRKWSDAELLEILKQRRAGKLLRELAQDYDVSQGRISQLVSMARVIEEKAKAASGQTSPLTTAPAPPARTVYGRRY